MELFEIYLADSVTLKLTNSTLSSLLGSFELTLTLPDIIHKVFKRYNAPHTKLDVFVSWTSVVCCGYYPSHMQACRTCRPRKKTGK